MDQAPAPRTPDWLEFVGCVVQLRLLLSHFWLGDVIQRTFREGAVMFWGVYRMACGCGTQMEHLFLSKKWTSDKLFK